MALDLGEKRIGIAISDPLYITAQGIESYTRVGKDKDVAHLADLVSQYAVNKIIVGFPKNMNNTVGESAEKAIKYADMLEKKLKIPVELEDERLTTVLAERMMIEADVRREKRRKVIDKMAAVAILQGYLDRMNIGK
ncbi:MAG: Holliday junction resolvase RuvX [Christensenellaceae bacterium]|jgi:putative Holliday junction resolvase